jgi:hypothetical protein
MPPAKAALLVRRSIKISGALSFAPARAIITVAAGCIGCTGPGVAGNEAMQIRLKGFYRDRQSRYRVHVGNSST